MVASVLVESTNKHQIRDFIRILMVIQKEEKYLIKKKYAQKHCNFCFEMGVLEMACFVKLCFHCFELHGLD